MKKRHLVITIAALSILCLSGCHKDKPVESQAPLETIQPDTSSETISDKLGEAPTLSIEEAPESLSEDALVIGYDTEIDKSEVSTSESESLTESISETEESAKDNSNNSETSSASEKETLSESEAQAVLESEVAQRESVQESADDWYEQNKAMESAANNYYQQQLESQMTDKELMDSLNPYK